MRTVAADPSEHIKSLPGEVQADIAFLDKEISKAMHGSPRVLWQGALWGGTQQTIIGYGIESFKGSNGKLVEWFIIGLAAQKNYISIYVNAVENKQYLTEKYADKLGKVKVGKSSISFKSLNNVNLPVLLELIEKAKSVNTTDSKAE